MPESPKAIFLTRKERLRVMQTNAEDQAILAGYMRGEERARFEAEMAEQGNAKSSNVNKSLPMDPKTLEILCEGFASGFLGKTLGY